MTSLSRAGRRGRARRGLAAALALLFGAFPSLAFALDYCEPLANLTKRASLCEDNKIYVSVAERCRDIFRSLVQRRNAELRKTLAGDIALRKGDAQNQQFQVTEKVYVSTDKTLGELIALGYQARGEVVAYGDDFLWPIHWSVRFGPFPGLKHPAVQKLFRSIFCYADNMEGIEDVLADFDKMIGELEEARRVAARLHKTSGDREGKLDDLLSLAAAAKGGRASAVPGGRSPRSASDVTGLREDLAKQGRLPAGAGQGVAGKAAPARAPAVIGGAQDGDSDVTSSFGAGLLDERRQAGAKQEYSPEGGQKTAQERGIEASSESASVGSVIWNESRQPSSRSGLELGMAAPAEGGPSLAAGAQASSKGAMQDAESPRARQDRLLRELAARDDGAMAPFTAPSPSASIAGQEETAERGSGSGEAERYPAASGSGGRLALLRAETDLFQAVRLRYRATELFRESRQGSRR